MLTRLTDRVYLKEFEKDRDRPVLGYVRGDRLSLAIDAGHSVRHVTEFYEELAAEGLKKPDLTAITHWHWDHTFGMHAVHGVTIANRETDGRLRAFYEEIGVESFLEIDPSIRKEYEGDLPVVVVPADVVYEREVTIDLGGVTAKLFRAPSPHTDDASLVYIPEEKVLFLGDSYSGVFPTWKVEEPEKLKMLIDIVKATDCEYVIHSHVEERRKEFVLADMADGLA